MFRITVEADKSNDTSLSSSSVIMPRSGPASASRTASPALAAPKVICSLPLRQPEVVAAEPILAPYPISLSLAELSLQAESAEPEHEAENEKNEEMTIRSHSSTSSFIDIIEGVETNTSTSGSRTDIGDNDDEGDRDEFDFVDEESSDDEDLYL